jgi:hypothetical protein
MLLRSPSGIGQKKMKKNEASTHSHGETNSMDAKMENSQAYGKLTAWTPK